MQITETKPATTKPWLQNAIDAFEADQKQDGDTLTHDWIKWALQIPAAKTLEDADRLQWTLLTRVEAFKDWLLINKKIALANIRGEGYRILPPSEQTRYAAEQAMRAVKKGFDTGEKLLTHARLADMTTEEQRRHTDTHVRLCGVKQIVSKHRKDIFKQIGGAQNEIN